MPKIGDYSYPELDPGEAIEIAETLVDDFKGQPSSEDAFAQSIGHKKASGGAYRSKLADLRKYGLIKSRGVTATSLAKKIESPRDPSEEKDAKFEMMENISLLKELHQRLDGKEPPGDLWVILEEVTGADRKEAQEHEDKISKLYNKMLRFDRNRDKDMQTTASQQQSSAPADQENAPDNGLFVSINDDEISLSEASDANIELAIQFLKQRKDSDE